MRDDQNEFIDLSQIVAFIRRNWGTLLACVLLAMACGAALFAILPARWQALTTIEIGQVPLGTPVGGSRGSTLIEPPAQTVERLKQRELINTVLTSLGIPVDQPDEARASLFRHSLKGTVMKNTNFIQIAVAGHSPDAARENLTAAARVLMEAHSKLMIPTVGRMMAQLEDNAKQMAEIQVERTRLQELLGHMEKAGSKIEFSPTIVAVSQLANKEAQLHQIVVERAELQDAMAPSRTYPTRIIDAVYVEPRPYFPKLSLFLAGAAVLGFFAGLGMALYRDHKRKARLSAP